MKTETTFIILFFFSGVFMSFVSAKPSPELMKKLTALERFLEGKEGLDSDSVLNKIQDEQKTGKEQGNNEDADINPEGLSHPNKEDADADKNKKPTELGQNVQPAKPDEVVSPETVEEGSGPNDQDSNPDGGEGEEKKPQENNKVSDSNEEKERDKLFNDLNKVISGLADAIDKFPTLINRLRQEFENIGDNYNQLKEKNDKTIEKTNQDLSEVKNAIEDIQVGLVQRDAPGKKSVHENSASRKRQLSDTEFLNIVQGLLTKN